MGSPIDALQNAPENKETNQQKAARLLEGVVPPEDHLPFEPAKPDKMNDSEPTFTLNKLDKKVAGIKKEYPVEVSPSSLGNIKHVEGKYDEKTDLSVLAKIKQQFEYSNSNHGSTFGPIKGEDGYHYFGLVDASKGEELEDRILIFRSKEKSPIYKQEGEAVEESGPLEAAKIEAKKYYKNKPFEQVLAGSTEADEAEALVSESLMGPAPRWGWDKGYFVYKVDRDTKIVFKAKKK